MTEQTATNHRERIIGIATLLLWVVTSAAAFLLILPLIEMTLRIYASFWGDYGLYNEAYFGAASLPQYMALILGALSLVAIVGGAEYNYRYFNTSKSWTFLARLIAVEISLFLLTLLI
jgi:hypothetical protein